MGDRTDDRCRVCRDVRPHTVAATDPDGRPARVVCDTCGSHHNWRGGDPARVAPAGAASVVPEVGPRLRHPTADEGQVTGGAGERLAGLEALLRQVLREEAGLTPVAPAARWEGGTLVLRPGRPGLAEKEIPIDVFFQKIVMLRNRLRTLEQQVNASDLPASSKLKVQAYITACYGTLTTFNVLFAEREDGFAGARRETPRTGS
ncbi:MAG: hypothetical protein ACE5IK_12980 [Acidobacteriota bacterium]